METDDRENQQDYAELFNWREWMCLEALVSIAAGYLAEARFLASELGLETQLEKELEHGHARTVSNQVSEEGRLL